MRCEERYGGTTFPFFRGVRCVLEAPHDGRRHQAVVVRGGPPLQWWTPEEKQAIRARKRARTKEDES